MISHAKQAKEDFDDNKSGAKPAKKVDEWRTFEVCERLKHALIKGIVDYVDGDVEEARHLFKRPLHLIEGPLMDGMSIVGDYFGSGKMFLP